MEKSESVTAGQKSEFRPPTYSSLLDSQSQKCTPPQPERQETRTTNVPILQNTAASDSKSPAKIDNGKPMPRCGFDTPNSQNADVSTESRADKKVPASSRSPDEAVRRGKTLQRIKIWILTLVILVAIGIGIGVSLYQRNQNREEEARLKEFEKKRKIWQKEFEEVGRMAIQKISKLNFTLSNLYSIPDLID